MRSSIIVAAIRVFMTEMLARVGEVVKEGYFRVI